MAKLRLLKANVAALAPRIGFAPDDEKARDKQRRVHQPWRQWYKSKRWEKLRQAVFIRDAYTCKRSGVVCIGKSPAPDSPVANHKIPHRGNPRLFWDINNIETVSKEVHDGLIQREEQAIPRGQWD